MLQPYLEGHNTTIVPTTATSPLPPRRRLLALRDAWDQDESAPAMPLGGFVLRNGLRVRADEAELADWIGNAKRKQVDTFAF